MSDFFERSPRNDAIRREGEDDRTDEFKKKREQLATAVGSIIKKVQGRVADGKGLPNGKPITVGLEEVQAVRSDPENPTKEGAFLTNENGKMTFKIHEHADDGQSSRTLEVIRNEVTQVTAGDEQRSPGEPQSIAGVRDTVFKPGKAPRYLGFDVMNDGSVQTEFTNPDGVHVTQPLSHPRELDGAALIIAQIEREIFQ